MTAARSVGQDVVRVDGLEHAYAVQRELTALRLARGDRVIGWKLDLLYLAALSLQGVVVAIGVLIIVFGAILIL